MQTLLANNRVKVVLPNTIGYERVAMASSASFAKMHGLPEERIEDLKTIVAEAAINAMQHGNCGRTGARVTVMLQVTANILNVKVTDEGYGFKDEVKDPDIDRIIARLDKPVGFGVFLIRNLADRVEFRILPEGGHVVEMLINLK
ncbi:MAG: ATP-binding protein [Desulfobacterales bacterium]|nr:ATP-binding protein [Desulfobacterales bacterium]